MRERKEERGKGEWGEESGGRDVRVLASDKAPRETCWGWLAAVSTASLSHCS